MAQARLWSQWSRAPRNVVLLEPLRGRDLARRQGAKFVVSTHSQETPFKIDSEMAFARAGHGTRLTVRVDRHLPDPDRVRDILSARFLHDPQFLVRVNGTSIALPDHSGLVESTAKLRRLSIRLKAACRPP